MEIKKSVDIIEDVLWNPKGVLVFLGKAPTVLVVCRSQRSSVTCLESELLGVIM